MKVSRKKLNNIICEAINDIFSEEEVNYIDLVNFCLTNDFLYIAGPRIGCANSSEQQKLIASEILQGKLEFSHDIDSKIQELHERNSISENVDVVKVTLPKEQYYIIWEH